MVRQGYMILCVHVTAPDIVRAIAAGFAVQRACVLGMGDKRVTSLGTAVLASRADCLAPCALVQWKRRRVLGTREPCLHGTSQLT